MKNEMETQVHDLHVYLYSRLVSCFRGGNYSN